MDLRDETREVEAARAALPPPAYLSRVEPLTEAQLELGQRTGAVVEKIKALPKGSEQFPREIALLSRVTVVMDDARRILSLPETGPPAIGAETEAIELLLRSRQQPPGGGGGGSGGNAGGGSSSQGKARSALALVGRGIGAKEVVIERAATHGAGGDSDAYPEEFRKGLETLFQELDRESR